MARNNQRRTRKPQPPPDIKGDNVFSFVIPTDFVALPSEGRFYPQEHPLRNQDVVEIKFMTAKEEDILTSQALLTKGIALERLVESVLVDKEVPASSLLVGDKNAILVATRITGYGSEYETQVTCPSCEKISPYKFDLGEIKSTPLITNTDVAELTDAGTYIITGLTQTEAEVEVRMLTGDDDKKLMNRLETNRKHNLGLPPLLEQMKSFIVSVNDNSNEMYLDSFLHNLPAMDARHLRKTYAALTPAIDMTQQYACDSCLHEARLEVPLTADFFWPE
jgi:hypothetical protein